MKPTTLDEALVWLRSSAGVTNIVIGRAGLSVSSCNVIAASDIIDDNIPAAIVEAVGEVWDQVHGESNGAD